MLYRNKFSRDIKSSELSELFILEVVRRKYPKAYRSVDVEGEVAFGGYDIAVPTSGSNEIWIEVKQDTTSKKTGFIAIEHEYAGKRSGIHSSMAHWWAIIFWDDNDCQWVYCILEANHLLQKVQQCRSVGGGDRSASKVYLLPIGQLLHDSLLTCKPVSDELSEHCSTIYKLARAND